MTFSTGILAYNKYFPDYKYDLVGFTEKDNKLAVILKQPVVAIKRSATPLKIKEDLEKRGFVFSGINVVRDIQNGIIIRDLHKENAVFNELDNIAYIDLLIQFEKNSHFWLILERILSVPKTTTHANKILKIPRHRKRFYID